MIITSSTISSQVKVGDKSIADPRNQKPEIIVTDIKETKSRFIFTVEFNWIGTKGEVLPQKRLLTCGKNSLVLNLSYFKTV